MNRIALFSLVLAAPLLLAAGNGKKSPAADRLPVGSLWVGTGQQTYADGTERSWGAMALYIQRRDEAVVEAVAWYPGLNSGVTQLAGTVDSKGKLNLSETAVLFGQPQGKQPGLECGGPWTGKVTADSLVVDASGKDQKSGKGTTSSFSLVRAPSSDRGATSTKAK
jgi:hypothetical protein